MRIVGVTFLNSIYDKQYHFNTFFNDLELNDLVVVDTVNGLQVARVTELDVDTNINVTKFVVSKVNVNNFEKNKEKLNRQMEIYKILDKKLLEQSRVNKYKILADTDEDARKLIDELESIKF